MTGLPDYGRHLAELAKQMEGPRMPLPSGFANIPEIENPTNPLVESARSNLASEFYDRLVKWIRRFDESLDDDHEVGVRLVSFGQTVTFHLEELGYWNPSLISFSGSLESGDPVELIQHVSQISILLMRMPRKDPEKPKEPIGFRAPSMDDTHSDDEEE